MDVRRRFRVRQHLAPVPPHGLTFTLVPSPKPSPPYSLTILSSYVPPSQSCTHHLGALRAYDYPITLPAGDGNSVVSTTSPSALASTSNRHCSPTRSLRPRKARCASTSSLQHPARTCPWLVYRLNIVLLASMRNPSRAGPRFTSRLDIDRP